MKTDRMRIALINGSPRTVEQTASQKLILLQEKILKMEGYEVVQVNVRKSITLGNRIQDFETIHKADALIISFPLYIFCLPGILTGFLQDFYEYEKLQSDNMVGKKIYTVVNCGFPEAGINEEAVRVVQSFSRKIGADFRFGIMIGGGGMIGQTLNLSFMKKIRTKLEKEIQAISDDIHCQSKPTVDNKSIELKVPSQFYYFMGGKGWISSAKGNGLKKKDLYRKPYQQTITSLR